jgi:hypothetical protein
MPHSNVEVDPDVKVRKILPNPMNRWVFFAMIWDQTFITDDRESPRAFVVDKNDFLAWFGKMFNVTFLLMTIISGYQTI